MTNAVLRKGSASDTQWLFELFRSTMRDYIDAAWGWDEIFQREGFFTNLPGPSFRVLESGAVRIGAYHVAAKHDHLWLELILMAPEHQRRGHGTRMLQQIQQAAAAAGKPVRLSVLKSNPAANFYLEHGFTQTGEDRFSLKMQWNPPTAG